MTIRTCAAVAVLAAGTLAGTAAAQQTERYALRGNDAALYNLAGEVEVVAGSGAEVVVELTRGGADAGRLRVERGTVRNADAVRVLYPEDRVVYPRLRAGNRTQLSVDADGTWGGGAGRRGRRVTVEGSGSRGMEAWVDARVRVPAGRSVAIHQAVGRVSVSNVDGRIVVNTASAPVTTAGTRGELDVDVGSGGVQVSDARGNVRIDTGSGGVRVAGVRGDRLEIDTGSGGVAGSDVEVGQLQVDTGSGSVSLTGVGTDDANIDTGSGGVRLELRRDARRVRIDTGSGGVMLGVPADFGAELEVETGSGGITVDFPVQMRRSSRSNLSGRIGNGDGRVEIDTGSGGVRIRRI